MRDLSRVPRPVRAIRVTRVDLEPSALARGRPRRIFPDVTSEIRERLVVFGVNSVCPVYLVQFRLVVGTNINHSIAVFCLQNLV